MSVNSATITDFINQNYFIAFQSENLNSPEEAQIFCLTELHINQEERKINAKFIDTFSDTHSLVAVEMIPSMKEIQPQDFKQSLYVTKNIRTIGWDVGTLQQILGLNEESTLLSEEAEKDELAQLKAYEKLSKEEISNLMQLLYNPNFIFDSEALKSYIELDRQAFTSGMLFSQKLMEIDLPGKLEETFPSRNSTMITTFEKTTEVLGKRFFLGGLRHFVEDEEIPAFIGSVQQLITYLKDKKAMILIPKTQSVI